MSDPLIRTIESAPKDGTTILVWRKDSGWLLARWIAPCDFLTEAQLDEMDIEEAEQPAWFYADYFGGDMIDDGEPTHWRPMPDAPETT